ncbi:M48 family metalloprotease [Cesiribacter sp. SM1]|uniref:M48 family metalloprotease n=1 Tax=Cesiribacter sp. SM1 TaxID=2861196 RepID=UPI001CD66D63|nr:M48 family metalloprotease [Cesiribacter sp. SM1]
MNKPALISLIVAVALFFNSCATNPVTGRRQVSLVSTEQEIAMGKEADPQIVAQFGLYENPELQRFIQQKGEQMAAVSHRSELNYEFKILDSPVINAFAVPGGYVYFTRGIMAHFNNEAQFAGVLGHEIGHITARHSAQQQTKATLGQVALIGAMIASPEFAQFGNTAAQGLQLLFLKYGRDDERQSDELGVEYSSKIGYDATEMADFFLTLQRQQEGTGAEEIPGFLSTHPNPGERYETVHELAAKWKKELLLTNAEVNRNSYLKMIDGMVYGEDPKQGFVENSIFYHPELRFQFPIPTNWQHQNSPQAFQMASPDGKAMMMLTLAQGSSLQEAAQQTLQQYGLQMVESKQVTVNGLPAIAMVADQPAQQGQQQGQTLRTLIYLIQYGGNIYSMIGVSSANDFNNYLQLFSNTMQAFSQLNDPDKLNRQPERIQVRTVQQAGSFLQVLTNFQVPKDRMEELAILNGLELTDRVEQGTMIKVIGQ